MQKFIIDGRRPLSGSISVAGDKNTALKIIPACILVPQTTTLTNVPVIEDVGVMMEILKSLGATVSASSDRHSWEINTDKVNTYRLPAALVPKVRASSMFAGPLLARFGEVVLRHPGGDAIGERPIDLTTGGFSAMGARIANGDREYHIIASKLRGARFVFRRVSVTATENIILAATLAEGVTKLINAAMEPGVVALAEFLNARGAEIKGAGTPLITIRGVSKLKPEKKAYRIIPDRIEAGTFACLAGATKSDLEIKNCRPDHMEVFLKHLELAGVPVVASSHTLRIKPAKKLRAIEVVTHEYPGFATDYQAPMTVMLTQAQGVSLVHETIFEGRLFYTDKLKQMGAKIIMADPHRVIIEGPANLRGRKIISPDIRAGIGLVIAGLVAEGQTTIGNIYQIDRGYEAIDQRLQALGAAIRRVETDYF
ncbi:MAG: UDP-N-acetylglucosamine 1-carboxyvinyltransferase [Parcubacteria group bacterium]